MTYKERLRFIMNSEKIKQNIQQTFDKVAEKYDSNQFFHISAKQLVSLIPLTGKLKILDLSTGTGIVALELTKKYSSADITAIDLSQKMLNQAQLKMQEAGFNQIEFSQQDAEKLPYQNHTFDLITCGYGLFFYPNMEQAFVSITQKIKPNGIMAFSSFTEQAFSPYAELFLQRIEKDYHIETPLLSKDRLKTKQNIQALADQVKHKKTEIVVYPIRYSLTLDEWWALLNNAGYKGLLDQLNETQFKQFKQDHLNEIDQITQQGRLEYNADSYLTLIYF